MEQNRLDVRLLKGLEERQEQVTHWIEDNRRGFLVGGALFVILIALLFSLLFKEKEDWSKARSEVEKDLQKMERFEVASHGELLSLAKSIEGRFNVSAEFAPLYEGRLAQALVQNGGVVEATKLLDDQEGRLSSPLPVPFKTFTESSLLIAKGEFEKAYELEGILKGELDLTYLDRGAERWIDTLYAFNLVRRALLADLIGREQDASALKKEIKTLLGQKDIGNGRREALEGLVEAYRIGPKTLVSYLDKQEFELPSLAIEGKSSL